MNAGDGVSELGTGRFFGDLVTSNTESMEVDSAQKREKKKKKKNKMKGLWKFYMYLTIYTIVCVCVTEFTCDCIAFTCDCGIEL